ncbi:hypothetical protein HZS_1695 [Henneguya salminicola]|nr:hypothetical protein HZS_1695 [Henneguya salminicola]
MDNISFDSSQISLASTDSRKISSTLNKSSVLAVNDDQTERNKRRKSRVYSTSHIVATPIIVSYDKLKDIYATCIKLSAENKITKSNAFGLQLIDYMQEVLQQIKEEHGPNFQVASCTLDASVKIYGHRVDCVHLDTYRIAGSLGHGTESFEPYDGQTENQNGTATVKELKNKKTHKHIERNGQSKIEKNLKNINIDKLDLEEESNLWNVMFARRPISSSFGRSGPDAYILNAYNISCDFGAIMIDPLENRFKEATAYCMDHASFPVSVVERITVEIIG